MLHPAEASAADLIEVLPCIVRQADMHDKQRWNDFLQSHPDGSFFHRYEWAEVLRLAFGHATHFLLAEAEGKVRGILPLAQVQSVFFGHALVSTPFCVYGGIVAADELAQQALQAAACELADRLGVEYLEMRNRRRQHPGWPAKDLYVTFRKEFSADPEKNMLSIPRKQRAMVRKGIQRELRTEIDTAIDRHYSIYSESLRNLGTPVFAKRYLRILLDVFGSDCEILTVVDRNRPVASVLSFYFREDVIPYYGGGTSAARSVAGNDFMYWAVMERARQRGKRVFDYGRSKRGTGAYDFKTNWGFEPQPLFYEYYLVKARTVPNLSPTNPKYQRMIRLWQKLPLGVTQLCGPHIAKYLG